MVEAVELIRQSELQDFLGDRCSVEAVQGGISCGLPAEPPCFTHSYLPTAWNCC